MILIKHPYKRALYCLCLLWQLAEPDGHNSDLLGALIPPPPPAAAEQQQRPPWVFDSYGRVQVPCLKALLVGDKRRQLALAEFVAQGRLSSPGGQNQQLGQPSGGNAGAGQHSQWDEEEAAALAGPYTEADMDELLSPAPSFVRGQVSSAVLQWTGAISHPAEASY